jgi:hypothetical protein
MGPQLPAVIDKLLATTAANNVGSQFLQSAPRTG